MIAGDVFLARARPLVMTYRYTLSRALTLLLSLALTWWLATAPIPALVWFGLIVYALAHLVLIAQEWQAQSQSPAPAPTRAGFSAAVDALLALLLLVEADQIGAAIYPLYILLALRVLSCCQRSPIITITPFLFGPTYLFVSHLYHHPAISTFEQGAQWGLLLGSLSMGAVAIWTSTVQQRTNAALRQELHAERVSRIARVSELERTSNDLRARMRELHALEEGLRVITSTLSLDEVLNQIVDSTVQMLGPARVYAMTLSLQVEGAFEHRSWTRDNSHQCPWAESLVRRVMDLQVPLIIGDVAAEHDLARVMPAGASSVLCVPLFVGDGPPRGALTVVSPVAAAFSSSDTRHLTAFTIQAGIAIHNAELHSRLWQQQQLLGAVVRDINDGLIVVDAHGEVVLANPIGQQLLNSTSATMPVQAQILSLVASMRVEKKSTLMCELRLSDDEASDDEEIVYQALASQVRQGNGSEPLVAIVLHDITSHKAEERARSEFISMVSHELRNPLNSLNGFIKVVLQGRAGALSPMQHEFLAIADEQIEKLKGRIAELLEYNRLEAGRLALNPQWNDLSLLVMGTLTRLRLQSEQAGLKLINRVTDDLPECYFDSERIGQVLTNLIENAIKATPPGGMITVRSEIHDAEIWIRVSDTGVGIPAEEQDKVFQRFYRVHDRTSREGNHLGLGLAICQQIIEGHQGRIWVESEEGCGSCFTFTLPLAEREIAIGVADY